MNADLISIAGVAGGGVGEGVGVAVRSLPEGEAEAPPPGDEDLADAAFFLAGFGATTSTGNKNSSTNAEKNKKCSRIANASIGEFGETDMCNC